MLRLERHLALLDSRITVQAAGQQLRRLATESRQPGEEDRVTRLLLDLDRSQAELEQRLEESSEPLAVVAAWKAERRHVWAGEGIRLRVR